MHTAKILLLSFALLLGMTPPASADRYGHERRYQHGHRYDHQRHQHRHHHRHQRQHWSDAATAAIIIGAIGIAAYSTFNEPEVHVLPPSRVPPPPPQNRYWYYCASAGQYYPYVGHCPEGWQAVLP